MWFKFKLKTKMDKFSSTILMLATFVLCLSTTEAQVTQWSDGVGNNPAAGATATFTATVAENLDVTTGIITLTATPTGALTHYAIETQPNAGQFEIVDVGGTGTVGQVTLAANKNLDLEKGAAELVIEVKATDATPGSGTATVTITVTDVNEFAPTFIKPSLATASVEVADKSTANTALYTVSASDADAGNTEKVITYSIASGNNNGDFAINGSLGAITVAKTLNKSITATYVLVIHATDAGSDPALKTGSATVSVTVCDPCSGAAPVAKSFISLMAVIVLALFKIL